jgi:hypothetical protein
MPAQSPATHPNPEKQRCETVTADPTPAFPFFVQAVRYTYRETDCDAGNGYTLICLHGMNQHKETLQIMIEHLLHTTLLGGLVKEVWVIGKAITR